MGTKETNEEQQAKTKQGTPDVTIHINGEEDPWCVVDAYNGTSEKEVARKLQAYAQQFPKATHILVFASTITTREQFVVPKWKNKKDEKKQADLDPKPCYQFKLYSLQDGNIESISGVSCDKFKVELDELNERYFSQFHLFSVEYDYWQSSHMQQKIIKTQK